jgi:hypothetical protein
MKDEQTETKLESVLGVACHSFTPRMLGSILVGLFLLTGNAWAGTAAIEGIVKDPKGQVMDGAVVRIEATGGSSWNKIVRTDAKGHYGYNGLVKASINVVKTKLGNPTKLNFDLKASTSSQAAAPAMKEAKRMVWMPAGTGSHIGGRWVEVDGNGTADSAGTFNVDKVSAEALHRDQHTSGFARGSKLPDGN